MRGEEEESPQTLVSVETAKVVRATLKGAVTAYGTVEFAAASKDQPSAYAKLSPAMAGMITAIHGVEGEPVAQGQVLFEMDSRAVDAAVARTELGIKFATSNVERQKKLIAAEGTSEKLLLESEQALASAKSELATAKVQQSLLSGIAPLSGILLKFNARPGEATDPAAVLAEIGDMDRLASAIQVPRAEAAALKIDQIATVNDVATRITYISPQADRISDTVLVRLNLPKACGLTPGQFVTARITVEERKDRLAVPRASVYTDAEGKTTLSIVEVDVATRKEVKTGLRDGDLVEVEAEGLKEGAIVVTTGSYALPEETKVSIKEGKTSSE